jgi:hypothetical protein
MGEAEVSSFVCATSGLPRTDGDCGTISFDLASGLPGTDGLEVLGFLNDNSDGDSGTVSLPRLPETEVPETLGFSSEDSAGDSETEFPCSDELELMDFLKGEGDSGTVSLSLPSGLPLTDPPAVPGRFKGNSEGGSEAEFL